jgi:hypothetical protein
MGMTHMPDVYISGERSWDCLTYGSDEDAFVVIGTALATSFQGPEMLFLLAREMGHCRAGHALWKTVIRFLLGEQGPRKGLMAGGLLSALSPTAIIEGAMEMPLLAWARQAEITADRAGLLAVGNEEIARKVLLSWSLKSPVLYRHINIASWLEQQANSGEDLMKLSELTTSSTPYISRRLSLLTQFAQTPELKRWHAVIARYSPPVLRPAQTAPPPAIAKPLAATLAATKAAAKPNVTSPSLPSNGDLRVACAACKTPMRIPAQIINGKEKVSVKCPNAKCGKIVTLRKSARPSTPIKPATQTPKFNERVLDNDTE